MVERLSIRESAISRATPQQVWALLSDVTTWSHWGPFRESGLEEPAGGEDPNGVGAIRRFKTSVVTSREQVVSFDAPGAHGIADAPGKFSYSLLSGMPLRSYVATVTVTAIEGGRSEIVWASQCEKRFAARAFWPGLRRFISKLVVDLARAAESSEEAS